MTVTQNQLHKISYVTLSTDIEAHSIVFQTVADMESPRVLSIQSHVVHGYVGNKSATFPLQVLGFEVDPINSVQLSNHTGYKSFKGQILNENDLNDLIESLKHNNLLNYTHLLTGYVGSPSFLNKIVDLVKELRQINPNLVYVCDPVMGDNGKLYVPESLLPIYQDLLIPLADVITPNQFELELLTGHKINSIDDAWTAINTFHNKSNCSTVIVSSSNLGTENELIALASSNAGGKEKRVLLKFPKLPGNFTGTGDLFAALFLAWNYKTKNNLTKSLEYTISTLQSLLKRTLNIAKESSNGQPLTHAQLELKIIQSKNDIEDPKVTVQAVEL
ncbi:pyridoxal kinase isoform X2 [Cimex lectularius]|uniref:Pyridoxal kinase n=1 Tax=Cimex lectularius TaxID=79782 RepID=A0A8I6RCS6_CIMLE|nr:pyridoxal kinase isoform X2 [Cimex lectularius]